MRRLSKQNIHDNIDYSKTDFKDRNTTTGNKFPKTRAIQPYSTDKLKGPKKMEWEGKGEQKRSNVR